MSPDVQQAPAAPNLNISDLVLTAQIIQLGASRGIFKAEEYKTVGDFYDRLVKFLEASGAISSQSPASEQEQSEPVQADEQPQEKKNAKARRKA